jgi:hypothetical protein
MGQPYLIHYTLTCGNEVKMAEIYSCYDCNEQLLLIHHVGNCETDQVTIILMENHPSP